MKIYLVRHGEKESEEYEDLLTETGERQIMLLARKLKFDNLFVSKIYSTNHYRSIKTAEILSKKLLIPVFRDDRIIEIDKEFFWVPDLFIEDEKILAIKEFVDEIVSKGEDVILAMHGGINRVVISHLTGLPLKEMKFFAMDLGSLSIIEKSEIMGKMMWNLKLLNDTTHLRVP